MHCSRFPENICSTKTKQKQKRISKATSPPLYTFQYISVQLWSIEYSMLWGIWHITYLNLTLILLFDCKSWNGYWRGWNQQHEALDCIVQINQKYIVLLYSKEINGDTSLVAKASSSYKRQEENSNKKKVYLIFIKIMKLLFWR